MAAVTGSIEERRFVVMRFERIKTWGHVYHVRRHNTREMECRHVEKDAPPPELIVGTADVGGTIRKVLERYGVKHKPGLVLALEFVISTSREVFDGLKGEAYISRLGEFVVASLRAFSDRFKIEGQIVSVALHQDERTPHLSAAQYFARYFRRRRFSAASMLAPPQVGHWRYAAALMLPTSLASINRRISSTKASSVCTNSPAPLGLQG
jgi:hypothetical protein